MTFKNILVPYDRSEASKNALDLAFELVEDEGNVTVFECFDNVYVSNPSLDAMGGSSDMSAYETAMMLELVEERRAKSEVRNREMIEEAAKGKRPDSNIIVTSATAIGTAAYEIAGYAEDNECDLIVMGRRGLGAVRSMLGSVSQRVAHETDIPLLLVK